MPGLCGWSMARKWRELPQTTGLISKKIIIRWPKKGEKAAFLNQHPPQDDIHLG